MVLEGVANIVPSHFLDNLLALLVQAETQRDDASLAITLHHIPSHAVLLLLVREGLIEQMLWRLFKLNWLEFTSGLANEPVEYGLHVMNGPEGGQLVLRRQALLIRYFEQLRRLL